MVVCALALGERCVPVYPPSSRVRMSDLILLISFKCCFLYFDAHFLVQSVLLDSSRFW